jgi:hypothetical protein
MTDEKMTQLAINTFAPLDDAVQQAKSVTPAHRWRSHRWSHDLNRVMRFDPRTPSGQPRSVRALERPRLDAALVRAPSYPHTGGQRRLRKTWSPSVSSRTSALPPARQQSPGHSGVSLGFGR